MLDNLREDADSSSIFDDDELPDFLEGDEEEKEDIKSGSSIFKPITDLTPIQRFVIVLMLFMAVCLIGSMLLLVTERFAISGF
ncbi:MAG: hypothetical protein GY755_07040 [Chloroflexi bacterium]|nr:hypothetical protein [Chloroflexota bacterium]